MSPTDHQWLEEKFQFIRIPKALFREAKLSPEGMLLYGLMLDRCSLSRVNGKRWRNNSDEVFIIFPLSEICQRLRCGHDKATKIQRELVKAGLIRLTRPDCSKPYEIIVLPFRQTDIRIPDTEKHLPDPENSALLGCGISAGNNTEGNLTEISIPQSVKEEDVVMTSRIVDLLEFVQSEAAPFLRIHERNVEIHMVQEVFSMLDDADLHYAMKKIKASAFLGEVTDAYLFNLLWDAAQRHCIPESGRSSE